MKHFFLFISLFVCFSISSFAQRSIQAMVFDGKNDLPIEMGSVRLLHSPDSVFVQGVSTDLKGNFMITKVNPGNYIIVISMVGYNNYYQNVTMANKDVILKNIHIKENAHMLGEVEVTGNAAQMVVKGDTTEFNATAFKTTQNAVVEDLLKRLPGVEVSTDGKITVNGQAITKIRVNGKKFFNDDIEMASKNIPAELIDKVQVLDQKSDMALLTGFEDNDTERIINLTFKPNRKRGTFGNVAGGAGMDTNNDFRYDGNMFLNMIDGDAQSTITGGGNNTNTSRSSRGRGGNNSGITTSQNLGYNNNSLINPKLKIGGDASINHSGNETITKSNRESYLTDSTYFNNSSNTSHTDNYSAYLRTEIEWKPDTLNTFVFQPNINYNRSFSESTNEYTNRTNNDSTSRGNTINSGNGTSLNGGLGLIYSHKFTSKKGRTFTANLNTSISQNDNESNNYSKNRTMRPDSTTVVDQYTLNHSDAYSVNMRLSYVEPLWNLKNFLETTVSFRNNNNISDKNQYNKDRYGNYTQLDSVYSNNFENKFYSETLELNYRYVTKTFNATIGIKGEPSQTYSTRIYENGETYGKPLEVINFAPTGRLQYNFGRKKFARIDYRGQTDQPSIGQLQPVKNNSNPMNVTIGNPSLLPDFNHNLRMMFTTFNDSTFSSFNASLYANITKDALVTNSIYDATQKQYSQTVNSAEMPYSIGGNVMFNVPLIQKKLHFNTNTSFGLDQRYGYSARGLNAEILNSVDLPLGDLSSTRRYNAGEQLSLTFTQDLFEIGARGGFRYSNTLNNLNPVVAVTKDWNGGGNVMIHLPYNINIGSDLNYTTLQGYSTSDQNQLIWNATIDKSIFKGKGVLAVKATDLLRQQLNIRQTIGDNYIQYNTFNTLTSYVLVSFTYKINKFKGAKNPAEMNPDFQRFGPGGDHPHRGDGGGGGRGGDRGGFDGQH